jgi:hypothetical protein
MLYSLIKRIKHSFSEMVFAFFLSFFSSLIEKETHIKIWVEKHKLIVHTLMIMTFDCRNCL